MRHLLSVALALALILQPAALLAQESSAQDARVYLKDGTVVIGQLLSRKDDLVIVRGAGGEILTLQPAQISKLVTLDSLGSQAQTVTVREFPYISFLGGTVAFGLVSWLLFDTASDRDAEARLNEREGSNVDLSARAAQLRDDADRARLWGWGARAIAVGSLGVALIPHTRTKKVFPELSLDAGGNPRAQLVYRF